MKCVYTSTFGLSFFERFNLSSFGEGGCPLLEVSSSTLLGAFEHYMLRISLVLTWGNLWFVQAIDCNVKRHFL